MPIEPWTDRELATALLAWAPPFRDMQAFRAAIDATRARLAELRRDDARLSLATAHSTKGAEFDHVAVVGLEEGRFPSGRAVAEAEDPGRAYEEERRLGYVAWTRARRTLTLSYDPAVPRRSCSRRSRQTSSASWRRATTRLDAVDLAQQPVDRVQEWLGHVGRQRIPHRILRAVGRAGAHGGRPQAWQVLVAESVRQRLEERRPAIGVPLARRGQQPVGVACRDQREVVDRPEFVAGGPA